MNHRSELSVAIIIVNYRVPLLLEQCLESVSVARAQLERSEVWVVDNASGDGSVAYLRERFPDVHYIENAENVGFARANNQAIRASEADLVLLLNPDTIICSDTLARCLREMAERPQCGAVGVRMYDIRGRYLRESKRAFPSVWASFCRFSGLTALFPTSKFFSSYYMGHRSDDEPQSVEVLIGAFMLMRRSVLQEVGLLDEAFFMYGEDIDLSYRIYRSGYECRYLPIPMIHYKGESSVLDSERYIRSFYGAMHIFYAKYYPGVWNRGGRILIGGAIALLSGLSRLRAWLRGAQAAAVAPTLVPLSLRGGGEDLPPQGSHVLVDKSLYTYDEIVRYIVAHAPMRYVYHFRNVDGQIVSPKG